MGIARSESSSAEEIYEVRAYCSPAVNFPFFDRTPINELLLLLPTATEG